MRPLQQVDRDASADAVRDSADAAAAQDPAIAKSEWPPSRRDKTEDEYPGGWVPGVRGEIVGCKYTKTDLMKK